MGGIMRRSILFLATALVVISAGPAQALPLTCEAFKNRLFDSVKEIGHVAQPMGYNELYKASDGSSTYEWHGVVGLTGELKCSPNDGFREFDAAMQYPPEKDQFSMYEGRLNALAAGTLCALSGSNSGQCVATAGQMHAAAQREYTTQYGSGEEDPVGIRTLEVVTDVTAEFDVKKSDVLWYIGPEDHDVSDERPKLDPKPPKQ